MPPTRYLKSKMKLLLGRVVEMFPVVQVDRCDVCGHAPYANRPDYAAQLALAETGCGVAECPNCGFTYLSPRPSQKILAEFYATDRDVFGFSSDEFESGVHVSVLGTSSSFDNSVRRLRLIQSLVPTGELLDVGAGRGRFMHLAEQVGYRVTGIEPGEHNRQFAAGNFGLSLIPHSVEEFEAGVSYDVVHCSHLLEHVSSPTAVMTRLYDWTRAGGICVIEVPNQFTNVFAVRNRLLHRYPKRPPQVRDVLHMSFFDLRALTGLCNRAGFRVVTKGSWYMPGSGASPWRLDYWLTRGVGKLLWGGMNIYVVARKPSTAEGSSP